MGLGSTTIHDRQGVNNGISFQPEPPKSPVPGHWRRASPGKAHVVNSTIPGHALLLQELTLSFARCFCFFFLSPLAHVARPRNREACVDLAAVDEMPPLELDAITVHSDGDSAVCGTAFFVDESDKEEEHEDPYAPATSLRLRIGEDIDWCDVGGGAVVAVLRRDDSTKGAGANPKSAARRSVQTQAAAPRSSMSSYAAAQTKVVPVVIGGLPSPAAAGVR
jgi:hypothetical protein